MPKINNIINPLDFSQIADSVSVIRVEILRAFWCEQGNRVNEGSVVDLPVDVAFTRLEQGAVKRALPGAELTPVIANENA